MTPVESQKSTQLEPTIKIFITKTKNFTSPTVHETIYYIFYISQNKEWYTQKPHPSKNSGEATEEHDSTYRKMHKEFNPLIKHHE